MKIYKTDISNFTKKRYKENVFKDFFDVTSPNLHDLVFFSPHNKTNVLTNAAVNKSLRIILDELRIRHITVHGLRHTHASAC